MDQQVEHQYPGFGQTPFQQPQPLQLYTRPDQQFATQNQDRSTTTTTTQTTRHVVEYNDQRPQYMQQPYQNPYQDPYYNPYGYSFSQPYQQSYPPTYSSPDQQSYLPLYSWPYQQTAADYNHLRRSPALPQQPDSRHTTTTHQSGSTARQAAAAQGTAELARFDARVNKMLVSSSRCVEGYKWERCKSDDGYVCKGGTHYVFDDEVDAAMDNGREGLTLSVWE